MLRYHNITTDDMLNGEGLRTVLWLSGCSHHCKGCHNPKTWDPDDGLEFDDKAKAELIEKLKPDYIAGLTLSGGDPLYLSNRDGVLQLLKELKQIPEINNKTIWLYTGYTFDDLMIDKRTLEILRYTDVLVDGRFIESLANVKYHWAGSTNQQVIDIKKTFKKGEIVLYETN